IQENNTNKSTLQIPKKPISQAKTLLSNRSTLTITANKETKKMIRPKKSLTTTNIQSELIRLWHQ
ncbi:UNVERIFIED_CONTAM: hypothetical protein NY100_32035, partial [Prevotella sp. 15_C9]